MLPPEPDRWDINQVNAERADAVAGFGFTERQARFLVTVMVHSGVFVERQYCSFAGIVHGQKTCDFLKKLVERRYATPIATGPLHRGRMFHVHYKPLYAAIGEQDNRHRKPVSPGRMIERMMVLDAVLADREFIWLGTSQDKRRHFTRYLGDRVSVRELPHLTFGEGATKTIRYFPDKMPIGIQPHSHPHVLLYLVTRPAPIDFRLFLLRHAELLRALVRWTIRVLFPRPFSKATVRFQHAAREHLATPLHPSTAEELQWFFRERQRLGEAVPAEEEQRFRRDSSAFRAPCFWALYRHWLQEGDNAISMAQSTILHDALGRGDGQVECVELPRQYLHLSSLVGVA
jgi:hypothetical protein